MNLNNEEINLVKKATILFGMILLLSKIAFSGALAADPIKIGVLLPISGSMAKMGKTQKQAVRMAVDAINTRGRIKDRKIVFKVADTLGNPDGGRAAVMKLIREDKVLAICGGFSSSATWAAGAIAQQNRIPFVVTGAAADKITEQGWDYVFRLNQPISEHLAALDSFLSTATSDIKSFGIMHAKTLRSAAAARRFYNKFNGLELEMVTRERFEGGADDLSEVLGRVKAKNPDLIYAVADDTKSAALLVRQYRALKLQPKLFIGEGNGFFQSAFASQAGAASNYIISTALWSPLVPFNGAGAFNRKFIDRYSTPPGQYGAGAYAAMMVIADALKRSRKLTPAAVRDALSRTNMTTLLGPIRFEAYNQKSQQNRLPTYLVQWINGKQEIIWPAEFATHKPVFTTP